MGYVGSPGQVLAATWENMKIISQIEEPTPAMIKRTAYLDTWRPYAIIAVLALLAFLPLSSMLFTLKNDVVAIDYPIHYFISESLQNGQYPLWMNTWCMGFPLQSIFTWGVYSTPRMLTGFLFEPSIYTLQVEFLFYIMAAGWAIFKLLSTHFLEDRTISLLLSCCYMLSGFTVGSSQWPFYLTVMTYFPLVIYGMISLLKSPSFKYLAITSIASYLLLTNIHVYLTLACAYIIGVTGIMYVAWRITRPGATTVNGRKILSWAAATFLVILLLAAAPVYYSLELFPWLERSEALEITTPFYQSNYIHPAAIKSLLLPLSTVGERHVNTEGSVMNLYIGLLPLLLLPVAMQRNFRARSYFPLFLLAMALFFLLLSLGHYTPLRNWMNVLPGWSYFRNPGVLRVFTNLGLILYLALSLRHFRLPHQGGWENRRTLFITWLFLLACSIVALFLTGDQLAGLWKGSFTETVRSGSRESFIALNALIQLLFLVAAALFLKIRPGLMLVLFLADLVVNTLLCTPFYTISSYSPKQVTELLAPVPGFPVQENPPLHVPSSLTDFKGNTWHNINVFRKEVSRSVSMPGPLILEPVSQLLDEESRQHQARANPFVYLDDGSASGSGDTLYLAEQLPGRLRIVLRLSEERRIHVQQAAFPGWKAYFNGTRLALEPGPLLHVKLPPGEGELVFLFEKQGVFLTSILLHFLLLMSAFTYLVTRAGRLYKKIRHRPRN